MSGVKLLLGPFYLVLLEQMCVFHLLEDRGHSADQEKLAILLLSIEVCSSQITKCAVLFRSEAKKLVSISDENCIKNLAMISSDKYNTTITYLNALRKFPTRKVETH